MFVTFSVFANCDAPVELALSVDENEPGRVILEYWYDVAGDITTDSSLIFRARMSNDGWVDIHQFEIVDVEGVDEYFIAAEECVPAGEWTYIIPFGCYEYACSCSNYSTISVQNYSSNCVNLSEVSSVTSEEFQQMQKDEYDAYPTDDDYENDEENYIDTDVNDSETVDLNEQNDGDVSDSQIDSDDSEIVETEDKNQTVDIEQSNDVDKTDESVEINDNETKSDTKSDGCYLILI
jgi:hypothetical protein